MTVQRDRCTDGGLYDSRINDTSPPDPLTESDFGPYIIAVGMAITHLHLHFSYLSPIFSCLKAIMSSLDPEPHIQIVNIHLRHRLGLNKRENIKPPFFSSHTFLEECRAVLDYCCVSH